MTCCDSGGWLEAVLVSARDARWCTRPYCTTCGCSKFRSAFWTAAARQAGLETARRGPGGPPCRFLPGFSDGEREATVRALVAGLRQVPQEWSNTAAFWTIILDLNPQARILGVPIDLAIELSGTPAGEGLARMEAYDEERRRERELREALASPGAVAERRRVEREAKARAHAHRQSQTQERNTERLGLLAALARLSVTERLSRFASDPALNLDCVSPELIPREAGELVELETATAVALLARIGRRRRGWGRLRRMIEGRLESESV